MADKNRFRSDTSHRDAVSGQIDRVFSFRSDGQGLEQGSSEV